MLKTNVGVEIANLLILAMIEKNTSANGEVSEATPLAEAEAKLSKSTRLADSSQRRGIQQTSEARL